jgi:two-component system response regulator HydG
MMIVSVRRIVHLPGGVVVRGYRTSAVISTGTRFVMTSNTAERFRDCSTISRSFSSGASPLSRLVGPAAMQKLDGLRRELEGRGDGDADADSDKDGIAGAVHCLWIPEGLTARPPGLRPFPAEASLSHFRMKGKPFYTLILRNVDERLEAERRIRSLSAEAEYLRSEIETDHGFDEIHGRSPALRVALQAVEQVAATNATVLLLGETGTGKGLLARRVHAESDREGGPFVTVNCAALPEPLLESELFGHVKGAFTGAMRDRAGLIAESSGGTLFLDEIGEMSPSLQAKLLDVLERRVVRAVGDTKERAVDLRVVAATHRDLDERVKAGAFREDLRYRLEVVAVELPPLRHRREDIPLLVDHYLKNARARHPESPAQRISAAAMGRLTAYGWPGNVRELIHAVERMVLLARNEEIGIADLPQGIAHAKPAEAPAFTGPVLPVREITRRYALWALEQLGGHRTRTAEKLGIDMKTLAKWLSEAEAPSGE